MTSTLTKLEHEVMQMLLTGEHPVLNVLRNQLASATIAKREFTGVGFFSTFAVSEDAPRLSQNESFYFGDVGAIIPSLQHGAGFVLHIRQGALDFLEGYTYDEPWPDRTDMFIVQYDHIPRDLGAILGR